MTREILIKTVTQAVTDSRFRSTLLKDSKRILSQLNLTRDEYSAVAQMTNESFDFLAKSYNPKSVVYPGHGVAEINSSETLSRYNILDYLNLVPQPTEIVG